ncbi:hypothetical protein [Methanobrevibacter sp.]|uniref:hypothetical protein n=1 Tax=Methanobrevibacter sp. TaxID=66852 RepID=UPI0038906767
MAEDNTNLILVIIGYILAIFQGFPIGFAYGLILYFWKKEDSFINLHSKIIIILSLVAFIILFFVLSATVGLAALGMSMQ